MTHEPMREDPYQHDHVGMGDRSPSSIDRFFELVEERIAAAEAATSGGHSRIESGAARCA